jgi:hypothetical protein
MYCFFNVHNLDAGLWFRACGSVVGIKAGRKGQR